MDSDSVCGPNLNCVASSDDGMSLCTNIIIPCEFADLGVSYVE